MKQRTTHTLSVLSDELAELIKDFRLRLGMKGAGYPDPAVGYPPMADDWGLFHQVSATRGRAYYGNETYGYNHHQTITKFRNRYAVTWSSGFKHEDHPGQHVRYAVSKDGLDWDRDRALVPPQAEEAIVWNNIGMFATDSTLYALAGKCNTKGNPHLGMCSMEAERISLNIFSTEDLEHWDQHASLTSGPFVFEGPRQTRDGALLCAGGMIDDWSQAVVLRWEEPAALAGEPELIMIPKVDGLEPIQCTWYQVEDGRILLYLRDGTFSCRLALTVSEDGGKTWSTPLRTDFPNTCSRAFAGRLDDGRYFIAGNNYDRLLDRRSMLIAVSNDGLEFDRMHTIVSGSPTRRIEGKHKEDGFHYPNCLADGERLLVTYSYNKEDIEVSVVDTTSFP